MPQVSMTVRMDSQLKQSFDALCREFGMSANTAINVFARAVVVYRTMKGLEAFNALREQAEKNGLQDMTLDEINEEIRHYREERRLGA